MKNKITLLAILFLVATIGYSQSCTNCINTESNGYAASAIGYRTKANANYSFASGYYSEAQGVRSFAFGTYAMATEVESVAIGSFVNSNAEGAFTIGSLLEVSPNSSSAMVIGCGVDQNLKLKNNLPNTLMIGFNSIKPTLFISPSPTAPGYYKTGRIGIGNVTSPQAKLHLRADAGEEAAVFIEPHTWEPRARANLWLGNMYHGVSAEFDNGLVFHTRTAYLFNEGNIGIGVTEQPQYLLEINGTTSTKRLRIYDKENPPQKGYVLTTDAGGMSSWTNPEAFGKWQQNPNGTDIYFTAGSVGVGTIDTYGYALAVAGKILTEEVMIKHPDDWYDNVLQDEYKLRDLKELERFINQHGHLPDIPSEKQVKESGISLGEMEGLLLKKIEELTLYTLQQQKMIEKQQKQIEALLKQAENNNR